MDKQKLNFSVSLVCAAVNVILNLALTPKYGALGAAVSTIATYIIMKLLYAYHYRKLQIPIFDRSYLFIIGLSLALTMVARMLETYPLILVALGYFMVYALVVYRLLLSSEEIKRLMR
jgi:O-antigen/teichoic acid export membrane protein